MPVCQSEKDAVVERYQINGVLRMEITEGEDQKREDEGDVIGIVEEDQAWAHSLNILLDLRSVSFWKRDDVMHNEADGEPKTCVFDDGRKIEFLLKH